MPPMRDLPPQPVYLGDEVTAAGYRLVGVHTLTPLPGQEAVCLRRALDHASLVLLGTELALRLPPDLLREARLSVRPPCLVVPSAAGEPRLLDDATLYRTQLGLAP